MFDLDAMQEADTRFQQLFERSSTLKERSEKNADRIVETLTNSDFAIAPSRNVMATRPGVCPMAYRK